jgi:hypothetical protein
VRPPAADPPPAAAAAIGEIACNRDGAYVLLDLATGPTDAC